MSRKFIASVVSAALLVTALGQSPARADDDLGRVLTLLLGAAIVGQVLSQQIDTDDIEVVTRREEPIEQPRWRGYGNPRDGARWTEPRPLPWDVRRRLLPGECLRSYDTRDGRVRVFEKDCLRREYDFADRLPKACEVKFRSRGIKRRGYDVLCLRRDGYQLARR